MKSTPNKPLQLTIPPPGHRVESKCRLGGGLAAERQGVSQTIPPNFLFVVTAMSTLAVTTPAAADEWERSYGGRLGIGGGARTAPGDARGGVVEVNPQIEMLIGSAHAAAGPMVDFRSANLRTAEVTTGLAGALTDGDAAGVLGAVGVGYAWRDGDQNGTLLTASLAFGLVTVRPPILASTTLYVSFRHAATGPSRDEITAGLSFGGGIWFSMMRIVRNL